MHLCWFGIVLLFVLHLAQSEDKIWWPYPAMNNTPAGLFNSQTQKCCLGNIYPSKKADYQKCCGSKVYDSSKQLCCNDAVFDMKQASACCGNDVIDTDRSICCKDRKVKIPSKATKLIPFVKCCGTKNYYDPRTQTCCSDELGVKIFNGVNKLCCGKSLYEESKQVCCISYEKNTTTYKVVPKHGDKTLCCGNSLIDPNTEHCCNNKVVKLDGCCGKTAYNTSTQICCNNKDVVNKKGKNMQCCGEKAFYDNDHVCCYDPVDQLPKLIPKTNPKQTSCCGMKLYDPVKQICCYPTQKVVEKKNNDDYECCGDTSFNYAKDRCCGGKLIGISKDVCCGDAEAYDPNIKICCTKYSDNGTLEGHAIAANPGYKLSCCGLKTYDTSTQICCGTNIFPNSRNTGCCGNKAYDFNKEVCCTDTVFTKKPGQDSCCLYGTTDATPECPIWYAKD